MKQVTKIGLMDKVTSLIPGNSRLFPEVIVSYTVLTYLSIVFERVEGKYDTGSVF